MLSSIMNVHVDDSTEGSQDELEIDRTEKPILPSPLKSSSEGYTETEAEADTRDPNWSSQGEEAEDNTADDDNDNNDLQDGKVRVERDTPVQDEPKFLVFYRMLLSLFTMFCFRCKSGKPTVEMKQNGTMVTVLQHCRNCEGQPFTWRSQPFVLGRYPAGNVLLSFAVLMAGASISKVLLVFRHMKLCVYQARTYFLHQNKFVFPAILHNWENYRNSLINQLKNASNIVWCGDGRFDSVGHSAKYGAYTMFCSTIMKVVHFELLQANQTGSSVAMELEGAKQCFKFIQNAGLSITTFISDRHRGIAKWIRQFQPQTAHLYDIWHVARSIGKKVVKASKEKGCELLKDWLKGIRNHLYWCVTTTAQGFEGLILAKWKSFMRHVANKHKEHPNPLFADCAHEDIQPRRWIKIGTKAYDKLSSILTNTAILGDIKKLYPDTQTSCLEGFHATLNHWHPKMICFSWLGTFCRHILASLHYNENLQRDTQTSKDGNSYYRVSYPKFKLGEEVVREVAVPVTYGYVDDIKRVLFSLPLRDLSNILQKYKAKVPEPLNRQHPDRLGKEEAIRNKLGRKRARTELFPPAEEQDALLSTISSQVAVEGEPPAKKKAPTCRKCQQPMRGHPRNKCPSAQDNGNTLVEQSPTE